MYSRCNISNNIKKYVKNLNLLKEKQIGNDKYTMTLLKNSRNGPNINLCASISTKQYNNNLENKNEAHTKLVEKTSNKQNLFTKFSLKDNILKNKYLFGASATVGVQTVNPQAIEVTNISPEPVINVSETIQDPIPPAPEIPILQDPIPEAPIPSSEIVESVLSNAEAPLSSLGLGGWGPVGIVQQCLEYLHVGLDVPWWAAIAIGTVVVRVLMFPLVVIAQRNGAKMNNYMPQLQVLQVKMTEARQTGNQLEAAKYSQEMVQFMKDKQLNPLKNMIVPLAQMPLFISFFMGLREMANLPVESMRYGGLFWFTDLTLPDQFFALPIITSLTMWVTIEVGTDSAKLSSQNLQTMKYVLRALPVIILPFTVNFPGAILCYWVCSNFISLGQVGILRIPAVRDYFKIERLLTHNPENLPIKNKGFVEGMKDSWTNMKITNELENRRRYDDMQFQRAGKGPVVKTYKYDPTKQMAAAAQKKVSS